MDEPGANPVIVAFLFLLRCLVPLAIMMGVSYLLRRFGWITTPPPPPESNGEAAPPSFGRPPS